MISISINQYYNPFVQVNGSVVALFVNPAEGRVVGDDVNLRV